MSSFIFPWAVLFPCAGSGSFWLGGRLFLPGFALLPPASCCWLLFTQPGVTSFLFCSPCFSAQTPSYCWSSIVLSSSSWNNTAGSWRSFKMKYPAGHCRWPLTPWMHLLFFIYIQYLSTVVICPLANLHFSIIPPTCAWICMAWILFPLVVSRVVVSYHSSADCGAESFKAPKNILDLDSCCHCEEGDALVSHREQNEIHLPMVCFSWCWITQNHFENKDVFFKLQTWTVS